jgi:hypothetical protein
MSQELVPRRPPAPPQRAGSPIDGLVGASRFAARAWFRGATWSVGLSVRAVRVWGDSHAAAELARDLAASLRGLLQELLEVSDMSLDQRIKRLLPPDAAPVDARGGTGRAADLAALREQADQLLQQAADVHFEDGVHPAYARILLELAPDEARILRLLASDGPQPAVDVRSIGLVGSGKRVAEGINMVVELAGARHPERTEVYLDNLGRLGLTVLASEPLDDQIAYQVLEAQPQVLAAVKRAGRARAVQRSIRLTPFGRDFCEVCLPPSPREPASARSPRPD